MSPLFLLRKPARYLVYRTQKPWDRALAHRWKVACARKRNACGVCASGGCDTTRGLTFQNPCAGNPPSRLELEPFDVHLELAANGFSISAHPRLQEIPQPYLLPMDHHRRGYDQPGDERGDREMQRLPAYRLGTRLIHNALHGPKAIKSLAQCSALSRINPGSNGF
jgi:hypothetical protein